MRFQVLLQSVEVSLPWTFAVFSIAFFAAAKGLYENGTPWTLSEIRRRVRLVARTVDCNITHGINPISFILRIPVIFA